MNETANSIPTAEEIEKAKYDRWFEHGKKINTKKELKHLLAAMRPGTVQYDAVLDGFDASHP